MKEEHINNYIAIRFSIKGSVWRNSSSEIEKDREKWFSMRAELFLRNTHRSLAAQIVQPQRIFVLMDVEDYSYWDKYLALGHPYIPIYTIKGDTRKSISEAVYAGPKTNIMLSRCDSDDMIADDYLMILNDSVSRDLSSRYDPVYIVSTTGFVTDGTRIQKVCRSESPFHSLFVREYKGETIYDFNHTTVQAKDPVLNHAARWMQVLHGTNVSNRFLKVGERELSGGRGRIVVGPLQPAAAAWPDDFPSLETLHVPVPPKP